MRVLSLTVPIQPILSALGHHQRAADSLEACRAWCVTWLPVVRTRSGQTQNQMADALGLSRQTYRAVELGEVTPSRDTLERILSWMEANRGQP